MSLPRQILPSEIQGGDVIKTQNGTTVRIDSIPLYGSVQSVHFLPFGCVSIPIRDDEGQGLIQIWSNRKVTLLSRLSPSADMFDAINEAICVETTGGKMDPAECADLLRNVAAWALWQAERSENNDDSRCDLYDEAEVARIRGLYDIDGCVLEGNMTDEPRARVIEVDGQLVLDDLDDPDALAMVQAVERYNLKGLVENSAERIEHFRERSRALGGDATTHVIVVLMVDDPVGGALADMLMPGFNWQEIRDRGEIPVARGLAGRRGIEDALKAVDEVAAEKIRAWDQTEVAVVVVDQGVADVF